MIERKAKEVKESGAEMSANKGLQHIKQGDLNKAFQVLLKGLAVNEDPQVLKNLKLLDLH